MRRAGRIIYNGAAAVSLLLCLATVGVWLRSYWVSDTLRWHDWPQDRSFFDFKIIWCSRGGIQFSTQRFLDAEYNSIHEVNFRDDRELATKYPAWGDGLSGRFSPTPRYYSALGFEWFPQTLGHWGQASRDNYIIKSFTLPLYFVTLLFALLPAHYLLRAGRRRRVASRRARGCCVFCGYDLRASAGRCPECGREGDLEK